VGVCEEGVISPFEGEMAGRPEGVGATGRGLLSCGSGGWRFTRDDPLCRLRRHLPLKGGDYPRLFTSRASRLQYHQGQPPRFVNTCFIAPISYPKEHAALAGQVAGRQIGLDRAGGALALLELSPKGCLARLHVLVGDRRCRWQRLQRRRLLEEAHGSSFLLSSRRG
jgi:hypothetical protein